MAKKDIEEELLTGPELSLPEIVRRYIVKYRETKGPNARRNTAESNKWFFNRITKDTNLRAESVHRQLSEQRTRTPDDRYLIGRLYLFQYDAKTKDQLPVWDEWPMVFFFNSFVGDGVKFGEKGIRYLLGINVHYLQPKHRLLLFIELQKLKNDTALREKTRLKMTWKVLKALSTSRYTEHAVKMYRADHMKSRLAEINPRAWEICLPMAIAQWRKGTKSQAWKLK